MSLSRLGGGGDITIWVTADAHYHHANILKYTNRPFTDVYHMDNVLIQNWNSRVGPNDIVFVLGDLAMGNRRGMTRNVIHKLNGWIILIRGNHDCKPKFYYDIDKVVKTYDWFRYKGVYMVHNVVDSPPDELVMCGHVHEVWKIKFPGNVCVSKMRCQRRIRGALNVGVDIWDYAPIRFDAAKQLLESFG